MSYGEAFEAWWQTEGQQQLITTPDDDAVLEMTAAEFKLAVRMVAFQAFHEGADTAIAKQMRLRNRPSSSVWAGLAAGAETGRSRSDPGHQCPECDSALWFQKGDRGDRFNEQIPEGWVCDECERLWRF